MIDALFENRAVLAAVAGVFGLCIGSFLNVVIHRLPRMMERGHVTGVVEWFGEIDEYLDRFLPRKDAKQQAALAKDLGAVEPAFRKLAAALPDETLAKPRSRCGSCGHAIGAAENIPLLSYALLRGRCSACGASISARYPAIELATGVLYAAVAWRFGFSVVSFGLCFLVACLVALTFIDADVMLLPDALTLPAMWAGLIVAAMAGTTRGMPSWTPLADAVWGAIAGYLSLWVVYWAYKLLTGKEGFGYGDFKLLAALGAWFGWQAILPIILMSAVVGAAVGIALIVAGRKTLVSRLPFGVYLAPAGIAMIFAGRTIVETIVPTFL